MAPGGAVDTLTLPASGPSCPGWACGYTVDDISGLTVGSLQIDSSANYLITPLSSADSIDLLNGLSFSTATTQITSYRLLTRMVVPLTLGAAQTWSVSGVAGTPTQLTVGAVTGESSALNLQLSGGVTLQAPELDTGPLTIGGAGTVSLASQTVTPADSIPVSPPPLISTQGVSLVNGGSLMFTNPGTVSGPIGVAPGSLSVIGVGRGAAPDASVGVTGNVTLRTSSTLQLWIDQPAPAGSARPQPGGDYSQLTALGTVMLNGASLNLAQGYSGTQVCAWLAGGQTYTLLSAAKLVGRFAGIGNGQVIPLGVCNPLGAGPSYAVIISYNTTARPQTVTATIVGSGQIRAEVANTLLVSPAQAYVAKVLAGGGYATSFNAPAAGTLTLNWTTRVHGRLVKVATGSNIAGRVGPRRVLIKLTAAGRRLLRHSPGLTLTGTAQFAQSGQSTVTIRRPVKLG